MINQYLIVGSIPELAFGRICTECAKHNQLSMFSSSQQEKANFYEVEKFCSSMAGRHEFSLTPTVKKSSPSQLEVSHNNIKSEMTGKHYSLQIFKIMLTIFSGSPFSDFQGIFYNNGVMNVATNSTGSNSGQITHEQPEQPTPSSSLGSPHI